MFNKSNKGRSFSKKRRFDYARKSFENPFFKKHKRVSVGPDIQAKILVGSGIFVFVMIVWFFTFCPLWQIDDISIKGLKRMDEQKIKDMAREEMSERIGLLIPRSNSLFFSEDKMASDLIKRYHFDKISVKKKLPNKLVIELKEKPFACIWKEEGRAYYSDNDGYIMEEVKSEDIDKEKYPLIINRSSRKIKNNTANIENEYIKFILLLFETAQDTPIGFDIGSFLIDDEKETVKLVSEQGPIIKFSTRNSVDDQIEKLVIVRHEKLGDDFESKEYIDLRYGDKIYFQ